MQNMKVWYRITDHGDGSSSVKLYLTETQAIEGLDEDLFEPNKSVPCQVDWAYLKGNITANVFGEGS